MPNARTIKDPNKRHTWHFAAALVERCFAEDGRLCAAAFVQNRKSYTGCTDAANPAGESGRPWCYVEAQVRVAATTLHQPSCDVRALCCIQLLGADAKESAWNFCAPAVDYDALRKEVTAIFTERGSEVQRLVAKLHKTQRAAEKALDRFAEPCVAPSRRHNV